MQVVYHTDTTAIIQGQRCYLFMKLLLKMHKNKHIHNNILTPHNIVRSIYNFAHVRICCRIPPWYKNKHEKNAHDERISVDEESGCEDDKDVRLKLWIHENWILEFISPYYT